MKLAQSNSIWVEHSVWSGEETFNVKEYSSWLKVEEYFT